MDAADLPADVRALYPFDSRFHAQPAGRQHFIDEGAGETVLLLHGNPTWSFYYRDLVSHLGNAGFRCIAPDHLGCGLSEKPRGWSYRLDDHIANVERLVDHLGLKRFHLVVHDWGGAIGMGLATHRSELIGKIVILNTAAFRGPRIPLRIAACRLPIFGEWLVRGLNGFARPATFMTTSRRLGKHVKQGYLWPYRNWHDRVAIARFVQDIPMKADHPSAGTLDAIAARLSRLADKPMLIAWGGRDWCFNDWYYEEWQRHFPNAATVHYADAGHYVLEDAREAVLPRIEEFLRGG